MACWGHLGARLFHTIIFQTPMNMELWTLNIVTMVAKQLGNHRENISRTGTFNNFIL